jgi:putative ABC transport system substrate-binding protein
MRVGFNLTRAAVLVVLSVTALYVSPTPSATTKNIILVLSQTSGPYQDALAGFQYYVDQQREQTPLTVLSADGDASKAASLLEDVKKLNPSVVATFGSLTTQAAVRAKLEAPLVSTLILNAHDLELARDATAVLLDFPVETQLQWLRQVLPQQTTVGVLFNPKANQDTIAAAARAAKRLGLKLITREVNTPRELPDALASLAKRAEVLWGIADPIVLSPQTSESLLLFSFQNRIPFIGPSTSWVKAGALYALDRDYQDLGAQCGELACKILHGSRADAFPPTTPRTVRYALNLKTASHMKIEFSLALINDAQHVFR